MSTGSPLVRRFARHAPGIINDLLKLVVVLAFVFPFYWMFVTSVKPYAETIAFPPTLWPKHFTLESYRSSLTKLNLLTYLRNSVIITLSIAVLQVIVMVPAAYAFARYNFFGKGLLFGMVLVAFMIPGQITFITTYIQMARWRLLLTLLPQIIPFGANAFGIFLLRQAFMQVPDEIIESAKLDNAGEFRTMTKILLPMCKSTLSTIVMFSVVSHWNSYFWPLVMTDAESVRPLTIAIERLRDVEYGINWSSIMAGNALLVIPIIIMFVLARKRVIEGFAYKGVK
jgi:sn-glycerol 3-phosphate transport system permease protein